MKRFKEQQISNETQVYKQLDGIAAHPRLSNMNEWYDSFLWSRLLSLHGTSRQSCNTVDGTGIYLRSLSLLGY